MKELILKSKLIFELTVRNNTLKLKNEELEKIIKEKIYQKFNISLNNEVELIKLREENRALRKENKALKNDKIRVN